MEKDIQNTIKDLLTDPEKTKQILSNSTEEEINTYKKYLKYIAMMDVTLPDKDAIWNNIKPKRHIFPVLLRYAAAITVLFTIAILGKYIYDGINNTQIVKNIPSTLIKNNNVTLLCEGEKIILDKQDTIKVNSTTIINKNNTLKYNKNILNRTPKLNTLVIPKAGEYSVILSDGTKVYLNSDSKLIYPDRFSGDVREVSLEGEGYFNVTKNANKPFIVKLNNMNIKVLGTTFNVKAYRDENMTTTTLVEGKVKVYTSNQNIILKPNQQIVFKNNKMNLYDVNVKKYISWINGEFIFENTRLEDVIIQLERWYNINAFFINEDSKDIPITGTINKDFSLERIVKILKETLKIDISLKNKNIYIGKI